jgi:hypothetical protein
MENRIHMINIIHFLIVEPNKSKLIFWKLIYVNLL